MSALRNDGHCMQCLLDNAKAPDDFSLLSAKKGLSCKVQPAVKWGKEKGRIISLGLCSIRGIITPRFFQYDRTRHVS
ncbi:hypothetical protein C9J01_28885 [Photobacterium rosenbergii]|uniref:Uncharacterized protein n=1 Tax=Photobacterium rosenbergii TaxID=294936 RepID=A0A2T3MUT2_9GAMM|nr:hypothetical protein C9J01_28885 [Photobacterium rosenbergii]